MKNIFKIGTFLSFTILTAVALFSATENYAQTSASSPTKEDKVEATIRESSEGSTITS